MLGPRLLLPWQRAPAAEGANRSAEPDETLSSSISRGLT